MGVLSDVTITQASAAWELRALAPRAPRHAMLSVWLLDQSPLASLTSGEIAEEIVRTLVGSIGLVLAIPITTAIAVLAITGPDPTRERTPVTLVSADV